MQTVLVVEDDLDIAEMVELYLRNEGYRTERAADGARALELWRAARPDLIVLDIGLPKVDGLEVLRHVRESTTDAHVPVIMLTARAEEIDELLGLGLGADDYITKPFSPRALLALLGLGLGADDYVTKPFSPRALLARVKAVLRRSAGVPSEEDRPIYVGALVVDAYRVQVTVHGEKVALTPTEFRLLHHLARTPGRAVTRAELAEEAMPESDALERAVDVHMKNVRHKLAEHGGDALIETVRGVGYRLREA